MKRSEAVKAIQEILEYNICPEGRLELSREATLVLEKLEAIGMLPPDHFIYGYDDMFDEPVKIRRRNSWEPED